MKKEMIKAIRLVKGFNPDLRVKLNTIDKVILYNWIDSNRVGIFGFDMAICPDPVTPEFDKYDRKIWAAVRAVISGHGE